MDIVMATSVEMRRTVSVLLALWDEPLLRGRLFEKVKKTKEGAKDYHPIVDRLVQDGKLSLSAGRSPKVSLEEGGRGLLVGLLMDQSFGFDRQLGPKGANVLLSVLRSRDAVGTVVATTVKAEGGIDSYEMFKDVVMEVFDRLNRDFNLDNLVPIYRIRREIGQRVGRDRFSEWLLEMQSADCVQLIGGEMPELTSEIAQDSIKTPLGAARYYVKRI